MITTMRGCVANHDLWPWPISSRSFGLDLENRVRSVASTVLDGLLLCLAQMITIIRGCVACYVFFRIWKARMITSMRGSVAYNDIWPWPIFSRSFGFDLENRLRSVASTVLDGFFPYLVQMITSMRRSVACDDLWPWPISSRSFDLNFENRVHSVTFSVPDRLFFLTWDPIWLNTVGNHEAAGVSSERRCSSCSSFSWRSIFLLFSLRTRDRQSDRFCRLWRHRGLS